MTGLLLSKRKCLSYLLAATVSILLMLNGCASKQSSQEPGLTAIIPPTPSPDSLSPAEMAALQTKGQIDKDIPASAINDIALQYKYYLRKGRQSMCVVSKRSEQYLAYAKKVFRDRGMPEELANLAIVESGYKADAVSHAGAAGAWQFMPFTGTKYGLTQDSWQDERLDPYRATEAAADYLKVLYSYFGDWPTAIAAYNAGEGKMLRAKEGTGGKDFFEVKDRNQMLDEKAQLKEETKQYVPRFLAVTKIMRNLPKLGFEPINPDSAEPVHRFTVAPGTDLKALSKACQLSWPEFSIYNQHHKRVITCTDKRTFVYVPSKAQQLAANYLVGNSGTHAGWRLTQAPNSQDSLEKISKRSNVPLALLQAANPGLSRLTAGQTVLLPPTVSLAKANRRAAKNVSASVHTIKAKETLYSISRKYNVSPNELMACNSLDNPGCLQPGQTLNIPAKGASKPVKLASSGKVGKKADYTVQPKDNLWSISRKHNVSVNDLKRWNNLEGKSLQPGTKLIVAEE